MNVEIMLRNYGGKQSKMRNTIITQAEGYLDPYQHILNPSDIQTMVFTADDEGPFWMSEIERHENHLDRKETLIRKNTKSESRIEELPTKGLTNTNGTYNSIKVICEQNHISLTEMIDKVLQGWKDKPKGMLQVAWERGLMDENNIGQYTVSRQKDEMGILLPHTSLKMSLGKCQDVAEEKTLFCNQKGPNLESKLMAKYHCKLAGNCIEYSRGCAKNLYRLQPLRYIQKKIVRLC